MSFPVQTATSTTYRFECRTEKAWFGAYITFAPSHGPRQVAETKGIARDIVRQFYIAHKKAMANPKDVFYYIAMGCEHPPTQELWDALREEFEAKQWASTYAIHLP